MENKSFKIYSDCLDITKRLKEIDRGYFVVFNLKRKKLELHNSLQSDDTFCLTIPYNTLDERTITLALKTRKEKQDELFEEIEAENEKNLKAQCRKILNEAEGRLYDC